ncbi:MULTISPECIES: YjfI family protein [unclassified Gilliamella]|uniref:YjfI family protein n=1 Tax=unclassified Gilliamella TaxID=2685620 RepID=UPI00226A3F20|nr:MULTISPECIES: YjfI family protein [unclassified Gilliamella]MCX8595774.1 YjfI family protein [Gilliamella sp. B3493]MCX8599416.1 YjfI family protein [Gilliamella sp. B3486]MCX8689692.1 YjfI family protein [Gilliamella sp. B2973]MCX8705405.1 YjfI family protein [Gilliamella sp. B3127]
MKKTKEAKSSAFYQQQYRQRLREQGLIKKEVWILPENTAELLEIEKKFRQPAVENKSFLYHVKENNEMKNKEIWKINDLFQELNQTDLIKQGSASIEIIDGVDACLHIIMHDYGDLPLFLSVSNQQIIVEALLWPLSLIKNPSSFNEEILSARKLFALSTIAIEKTGDGEINYIMYGALSSSSTLNDIIYELEMLSDNVIKATEAYEHFFNIE